MFESFSQFYTKYHFVTNYIVFVFNTRLQVTKFKKNIFHKEDNY